MITNKNRNSTQYFVMICMGKNKRVDACIQITDSL